MNARNKRESRTVHPNTQCGFCKRKTAVYRRPYSNEKLCRKCYLKNIEEKTRMVIAKYALFTRSDFVAVALSGGKDSTALLHILALIEANYPDVTLSAITVDEGVKNYRDEALKIARKTAEKLGVKHYTTSFKKLYGYTLDQIACKIAGNKKLKLTPCAYCGPLRRQALNMKARQIGATKLATAHTLNDETQTILLNIVHGNIARLGKTTPKSRETHPMLIPRVKPFCLIPERDIAFYAYLSNIEFQSKSCPYAGAALRNDVRDILNRIERKHPGTNYTVYRSIEKIRPSLRSVGEPLKIGECSLCGEPTVRNMCNPCEMLTELRVP